MFFIIVKFKKDCQMTKKNHQAKTKNNFKKPNKKNQIKRRALPGLWG